uniref:immunoglobulin lambda-1 light chain-like isoform X2 n=1 Tax=Geotrypetes seraphini TaxID=260995 RepID=UPI001458C43F|nr:immunoglobulin lambda-1 light chain-like isoform X2 [Geotrypetes seraphini]
MSWALLLLTLFTCCAYVSCQSVVTQESSLSAFPREAISLTCRMSGEAVSRYPSWYQQKQGQAPRLLVYSSGSNSNNRPSGVPNRFSGSISGSSAYLNINELQAEDEADYYCCKYDGKMHFIFGSGTQLSILSNEVKSPSVMLFPPSKEERDTNKTTAVCTMVRFSPSPVSVSWYIDGQEVTSDVLTSRATKQSDNLFMASSYLSHPDLKSANNLTCEVTHQGKKITKTVKQSEWL